MPMSDDDLAIFVVSLYAKILNPAGDLNCGKDFFYAKETCKELGFDFCDVLDRTPWCNCFCDCELVINAI